MLPWYKGSDVRSNPAKTMGDHILVVDDEPGSREGLRRLLQAWGFEAETAASGEEALARIDSVGPSAVITDLVMPGMDGLQLLQKLQSDYPVPVIVLTGQGTIEQAVEAVKLGAQDFLEKPVEPAKLKILLERLAGTKELLAENRRLRAELRERGAFGRLRGSSEKMRACYRQIEQVAPSTLSVLIVGESGTGKELVAQTLHDLSPRRRNEFVALNCAAIPPTLLESEIWCPLDDLKVAMKRPNDVSVVDTSTLEVIQRIPVGRSPWGVVIRPDHPIPQAR